MAPKPTDSIILPGFHFDHRPDCPRKGRPGDPKQPPICNCPIAPENNPREIVGSLLNLIGFLFGLAAVFYSCD